MVRAMRDCLIRAQRGHEKYLWHGYFELQETPRTGKILLFIFDCPKINYGQKSPVDCSLRGFSHLKRCECVHTIRPFFWAVNGFVISDVAAK